MGSDSSSADSRRIELGHERGVLALAIAAGLPGTGLAIALLWRTNLDLAIVLATSAALVACWIGFAIAARGRVARSLRTLAGVLGALREGDFSIRARASDSNDALASAIAELNQLGQLLQDQRLGALEASALLRRVMGEIGVAIFAFDDAGCLRLLNRHAEELLGRPMERLIGSTAAELGLASCLDDAPVRTVPLSLPSGAGRWLMRRSTFRQGGTPHSLLVLSEVGRALREEEYDAWRRMVRVLSHEINNSLTPISSVAQSLSALSVREPRPDDWEKDLREGLGVIAGRSEGLRRIMASYARLARLPAPQLAPVSVATWVRRVVAMETRLPIEIGPAPKLTIEADADQLDQLLINLVGNAVDAALETGGGVRISWSQQAAWLLLRVEDEGRGLAGTENLFVPFFTTKPEGSGIGLALSRQIADAHGGDLSLENRTDRTGCIATLKLPSLGDRLPA